MMNMEEALTGKTTSPLRSAILLAMTKDMEAAKGAKVNAVLEQNYQLKIAIVCEGHWIAVAMYGKMGFHELSDHHTIGCGIHIIP